MSEETDKITIHFSLTSSPSTPRITRDVSKDTKASALRTIAAEATHIPLASIKLIFRGRIIQNDDKLMTEYSVDQDSVIHCLGKPVKTDANSAAAASVTTTTDSTSSVTTNAAAGATTTTTPAASEKKTIEVALQTLKSQNAVDVYSTAVTTLQKVVSNILSNPNEEKFRKLKQSNAAFGRRLGNLPGGHDAMLAVGFVSETPEGADEPHFVLTPSAAAWNVLQDCKTKIEKEANDLKRNQPTPSPFSSSSLPTAFPSMPSPSAGGFGSGGVGMPNMNMPGMPPMTPAMQQQMSNMMSNPDMIRNMLENPMVRQMMQNDPRVANNPMLRQALSDPNMVNQISQMMSDPIMRNMMSNPAMMQNMSSMMNSMGGMGGGAGAGNNTSSQQPPTQPDPAAFARMMQAFGQMQEGTTGNNTGTQQQPPSNTGSGGTTNNGGGSGNDSEMTEEEMIAEAIARSLRES